MYCTAKSALSGNYLQLCVSLRYKYCLDKYFMRACTVVCCFKCCSYTDWICAVSSYVRTKCTVSICIAGIFVVVINYYTSSVHVYHRVCVNIVRSVYSDTAVVMGVSWNISPWDSTALVHNCQLVPGDFPLCHLACFGFDWPWRQPQEYRVHHMTKEAKCQVYFAS